jgi:small subunit ribosomal protein S20
MPHIPIHPSAEKRHRQSIKRQIRNRIIKSNYRTVTKQALVAIEGSNLAAAQTALRAATKVLQKAASKGVLPRNTASRKIGRLSRRLHRAQLAQAAPAASS